MQIIFSPKCLEYKEINHPESPERIESTVKLLKEKGFIFLEPEPASESDLLLVHLPFLIKKIKNEFFVGEKSISKKVYDFAILSVGGAIRAMEESLAGRFSFSLMRPPGHHAGSDFYGGFCYFNNIAVAVAKALKKVSRVAILDIDCHHGNGTEEIFLRRMNVLYVSLHESLIYPGTGSSSSSNAINFPLPPYTGESEYLETLKRALNAINNFQPNLLAISAGFDTYKNDPITNFNLEIESYYKIGKMIAELRKPYFIVLEGGYSNEVANCILNFLNGLES